MKTFTNQCNKCYSEPNEQEGCFTFDVSKFIMENIPPCLNGTWHTFKPEFKQILISTED